MLITVFTPTYNRAHLLPRLYESLCRQTFKEFEWLIVDDGSTDGTQEWVNSILNSQFSILNSFSTRYFYQENGGKHKAVNRGVKVAKGELFFIADSDDRLQDDALEIVAAAFEKIREDKSIAGVVGLDCFDKGEIVGSGLPKDTIDCNAIDIRLRHHVTGDLKEVFRTSVLKEFPFPEIEGERFCPEQLVWFRIAQKYRMRYFNKPIYIAEYQEQGITANITRTRMNSPIASMMTYAELNSYAIPFASKIKAAINYWRFRMSCSYHSNEDLPKLKWWYHWTAPLGYAMHLRDLTLIKR